MKVTQDATCPADQLKIKIEGSLSSGQEDLPKVSLDGKNLLTLDLEYFQSVNSIGIVHFMRWIKQFAAIQIQIEKCPKFFVDQINMVGGLLPKTAKIQSFYVPYFCEEDESSKMVLYTLGREYQRAEGQIQLKHPKVVGSNNEAFELDVFDSKFFRFLDQYA